MEEKIRETDQIQDFLLNRSFFVNRLLSWNSCYLTSARGVFVITDLQLPGSQDGSEVSVLPTEIPNGGRGCYG